MNVRSARRDFLRFLAASPLAATMRADEWVISNPKEAFSVLDFEAAAKKALPPAHFGYMATGVDDDITLRANREGFSKFRIRPRRLIDVTKAEMKVDLLGTTYDSPIVIAPCGNQRAFHPEGEHPTIKAAASRKTLQILSTATNTSIEDATKIAGRPLWYQLYATNRWEVAKRMIERAEGAGSPVLVWTVDTQAGRNTETFLRMKRLDSRKCETCHDPAPGGFYKRKPMFDGFPPAGLTTNSADYTWDMVRRIRDITKMKFLIKGIETGEDAQLCREYGLDGIIVSNHGGRAEESGRGTIECLPEVVEGAGKLPVMIDGGFRRGTDIFKALALGARAICIGRPYLWGLSAFGQEGVEQVIDIMRREFDLAMKQAGTRNLAEITRKFVV
jgi:4-hydroxymandelate oxidase